MPGIIVFEEMKVSLPTSTETMHPDVMEKHAEATSCSGLFIMADLKDRSLQNL